MKQKTNNSRTTQITTNWEVAQIFGESSASNYCKK